MPWNTPKPMWLLLALTLSACGNADGLRQKVAAQSAAPSASASEDAGTPAPSPTTAAATEAVPEEFQPACGKPGARVETERLEIRIRRSDCDLTGVTIVNQGRGATVPKPGVGVGSSAGVTVQVDKVTGDMTFRAEATVPNA